jgi:putative colanic acid biosynthesis acetyltransferase WcaF
LLHNGEHDTVRLDLYERPRTQRSSSYLRDALWYLFGRQLLRSVLPGSKWRAGLLRLFGAAVGREVVLKPRIDIKSPWALSIGPFSWIGEGVIIDNIAPISIGQQVCISQHAYLCSGSHDWSSKTFDLFLQPIEVEDYAWLTAGSKIGPGVRVGCGAVLTFGSVAVSNLEPWGIYAGCPATFRSDRQIIR